MEFKDKVKLSFTNFIRHGFKTGGSIIIVTIVILMFNLTSGFFLGIKDGMINTVAKNDDLKFIQIRAKGNTQLMYSDLKKISEVDGIACVFPKITSLVGIETGQEGETTTLLGVPDEALPYFIKSKTTFGTKNDIFLNIHLSKFNIGEQIDISYNVKIAENEGTRESTKAKIVEYYQQTDILDIAETLSLAKIDFVYDIRAKFYNMPTEKFKKEYNYDSFLVLAKDINDLVGIAQDIENKGFFTNYSMKASKSIPIFFKVVILIAVTLIVLLLMFACISISSVIGQLLKSRYREIGILKALGFSQNHIATMLLLEVLYIGIASFLNSIALTVFIIFMLNHFISNTGDLSIFKIHFGWLQIISSIFLVIAVVWGASLKVILRASRLTPIETIRS